MMFQDRHVRLLDKPWAYQAAYQLPTDRGSLASSYQSTGGNVSVSTSSRTIEAFSTMIDLCIHIGTVKHYIT